MRVGELRVGEPLLVLAARRDERVDQRVAGLGVVLEVEPGDRAGATEVVALLAHPPQQPDCRDRGVQADGVADAGVLGRVGREHQRDLALRGRHEPQPGMLRSDPGHPCAALGVGHVAGQPVLVDLLEGERRGDDPPVELGDRDLGGRVERSHAVVGGLPLLAAAGQAEPLQDRDVQGGHPLDVPGLVLTAGRRRGRLAPTRREHGDDQGVQAAECVVQVIGGGPQRRGEDRQPDSLTRRVDGVGQRVREVGVPTGVVRPVEQHPHLRQGRWSRTSVSERLDTRGRSSHPHAGISAGGSKPSPVSSTVSERNACSWARFPGPPSAR